MPDSEPLRAEFRDVNIRVTQPEHVEACSLLGLDPKSVSWNGVERAFKERRHLHPDAHPANSPEWLAAHERFAQTTNARLALQAYIYVRAQRRRVRRDVTSQEFHDVFAPLDPANLLTLGESHARNGDYVAAVRSFAFAVRLNVPGAVERAEVALADTGTQFALNYMQGISQEPNAGTGANAEGPSLAG